MLLPELQIESEKAGVINVDNMKSSNLYNQSVQTLFQTMTL